MAIGVMSVRVHYDRRRQHVLLRQEAPSPIPDWHINGIIITVEITLLTIRTHWKMVPGRGVMSVVWKHGRSVRAILLLSLLCWMKVWCIPILIWKVICGSMKRKNFMQMRMLMVTDIRTINMVTISWAIQESFRGWMQLTRDTEHTLQVLLLLWTIMAKVFAVLPVAMVPKTPEWKLCHVKCLRVKPVLLWMLKQEL